MRKLAAIGQPARGDRDRAEKHRRAAGPRSAERRSRSSIVNWKRWKRPSAELAGKAARQITTTIAEQQARAGSQRAAAAALGKQIAQIGEQLGAAKEHRSGLISRQKLLKDLEAKREGVSEGVKSVLRQRETKFPFIRGLVADVLRVDVEHAHVIEAALDGRDQWLVTHDSAAADAAREALDDLEGRVNILCTDRLQRRQIEDLRLEPHPQSHSPGDRSGAVRAGRCGRSPGICWAERSSWMIWPPRADLHANRSDAAIAM